MTADISEAALLETIYKTTYGESWTRSDNWCSDRPLSEWYGITTDSEGNVTSINLENNNLSGSLTMYLSSFAKLTDFNVNNNPIESISISGNDNIRELELKSCVKSSLRLGNFDAVTINDCDSLSYVDNDWKYPEVTTFHFIDCQFSQDVAKPLENLMYSLNTLVLKGCTLHTLEVWNSCARVTLEGCTINYYSMDSSYLTVKDSSVSEGWNGDTRTQLDIINSTCTGITNGNFYDDTVINLENATLWQSSWDEAPLGTFTRTLTGAEWPTLFQ